MQSQLGLAHFWSQGDLVTHTTAAILALLSLASWSVIISKLLSTWRASRSQDRALTGFWHANSLPEALEGLRKDDPSGIFSGLALTGAHAAQSHQQNATRGIGAGVNASEFITRSMRSHIVNTQARNERGERTRDQRSDVRRLVLRVHAPEQRRQQAVARHGVENARLKTSVPASGTAISRAIYRSVAVKSFNFPSFHDHDLAANHPDMPKSK